MNVKELEQIIDNLNLEDGIELENIPDLDLYMDQVITLFENKLQHTKRYETDKLLTKTMINNYTKDGLLMPAVKKKYTREHVLLMLILYELKQTLSIGDIKELFNVIIKEDKVNKEQLEQLYRLYLNSKEMSIAHFKKDALDIEVEFEKKYEEIPVNKEDKSEEERIKSVILSVLFIRKANFYKKLAETLIDSKIKQKQTVKNV